MTESPYVDLDDDRSQDPAHRDTDGTAIEFDHLVVPDHQDAVVVGPPDGHHLVENPALHLGDEE
jgi:hypothetical protein